MIIKEKYYDLDGDKLVFRSPREDDWQEMIDFLKIVNGETRFLTKEADEVNISEKSEKAFIHNINNSDNSYMILAIVNGNLAGIANVNGGTTLRSKHRGSVGIALKQKYTKRHIGTLLLNYLIELSKDTKLEQLELSVVKKNIHAYNLYHKCGFEHCGTTVNAMKYLDGSYDDEYMMIKKL